MPRRKARRSRGQPTKLTRERRTRILELIEDGNHLRTACAAAGVSHTAFYRWLNRGEDARETAESTGQPIPDAEAVYVEFVDAVARARARAETKAVSVVQRSMVGGFVLSEEPLQNVDGDPVCDPATGEVLYKRTYSQPDGRLALQYLERSRPTEWGRQAASKVELSGPDGGPVQVEQSVVIASLAERVAGVVAAREADRELEAAEQDEDGAYQLTGGED
jgi:hypothetical protein